jgi:hypothetical protein
VKAPRTLANATAQCERLAAIGAQLALIEGTRATQLAATNRVSDELAAPLLKEAATIRDGLQAWWADAAAEVAPGRKSTEIGGCKIGTRAGRAKLDFAHGDDVAALAVLQEHKWAKPYVRIIYAVDKAAALAGLTGRHAAGLAELGFSSAAGAVTFFAEPVAKGAGAVA